MVAVVVIVIAAAVAGAILPLRSQAAIFRIKTTTVFATAGQPVIFEPDLTLPSGVTASAIAWTFGDGTSAFGAGTSVSHTFEVPGTFFVGGEVNLSNGAKVNNFDALYAAFVGPRTDLTDRDSLGIITINKTASSAGAPVINPGGTIVGQGAVQQAPGFFLSITSPPAPSTTHLVHS